MRAEITVGGWICTGDVEKCTVGLTIDGLIRHKTVIHKRDRDDDHELCRRMAVRKAARELALDWIYDSVDDDGKRVIVEGGK